MIKEGLAGFAIYRLSSESPVLQGGIQRADALCYTVFAGTITKFLH
jgi:hypothetical protein